jgi:hypothetical protein
MMLREAPKQVRIRTCDRVVRRPDVPCSVLGLEPGPSLLWAR